MFVRVRNWVADATAGVKIRADYHDTEDDGFAAGLSQCVVKDGQTVITQNIPMNSKRIIAMQDPVNPQDAATKAYADLKLPLAGGTITGNLVVTGAIGTTGYYTRAGVSGAFGASLFNFTWDGSYLNAWVDASNLGPLATTAYVETRGEAWAHYVADPKVNRAGDTMTGGLAVNGSLVAVGSNAIFFSASAGGYLQWGGGGTYTFGGGGTAYHTGNLVPVTNGRLAYAADGIYNDLAGGVVTGLTTTHIIATSVDYYVVTSGRYRYLQLLTPGGWYTVASV